MSCHSGLQACDAFYGRAQALHEVSLDIRPGEIVSLVGRNGAGKSTVLKSIAGLVKIARGSRYLAGQDCTADTGVGELTIKRPAKFSALCVNALAGG